MIELLMDSAAEDHRRGAAPGPLVEFDDGPATFLFVNDSGSRLQPAGAPIDCTDAAHRALQQIADHRGQL